MAGLVPYTRFPSSIFPFGNWFDAFNGAMGDISRDSFYPSSMQMDVEDGDNEYVVSVSVPGVERDQIDVEMNQGRLIVTVDKKDTEEQTKKNYLRRETSEYHATRSIFLKDAARTGLSAALKDGVLTVNVPKKKEDENVQKISID